jgi:hypothetical protein
VISDLMFESGFGGFDGRRRPILSGGAVLALPLPLGSPQYRLHLRLAATERVAVMVAIDGVPSSQSQPTLVGPGEADVAIDIPPTAVSGHIMTRVRLRAQEMGELKEPGSVAVMGVTLETA